MAVKEQKKLTILKGTFEKISKPEVFHKEGLVPIERSTVTVSTEDGQIAFFEARKKMIETIKKSGYKTGDKIEVGFVFMGTQKGDRVFNNLFLNTIKKDDGE